MRGGRLKRWPNDAGRHRGMRLLILAALAALAAAAANTPTDYLKISPLSDDAQPRVDANANLVAGTMPTASNFPKKVPFKELAPFVDTFVLPHPSMMFTMKSPDREAVLSIWPPEHCSTVIICTSKLHSKGVQEGTTPTEPKEIENQFLTPTTAGSDKAGTAPVVCDQDHTARFHMHQKKVYTKRGIFEFSEPRFLLRHEESRLKWKDDKGEVFSLMGNQRIAIFTSSPYCFVRLLEVNSNKPMQKVRQFRVVKPLPRAPKNTAYDAIQGNPTSLPDWYYDPSFESPLFKTNTAPTAKLLDFMAGMNGKMKMKDNADEDCCPLFWPFQDFNDKWAEVESSYGRGKYIVNEYRFKKRENSNLDTSIRSFKLEMMDVEACEFVKLCLDKDEGGVGSNVCENPAGTLEIFPMRNVYVPFDSNDIREFAVPVKNLRALRIALYEPHHSDASVAGDFGQYGTAEVHYDFVSELQAAFVDVMGVWQSSVWVNEDTNRAQTPKMRISLIYPDPNKCKVRIISDMNEDYDYFDKQFWHVHKCTCKKLEKA